MNAYRFFTLTAILLFCPAALSTEIIDEEPVNETPVSVQDLEGYISSKTEALLKLEESYISESEVSQAKSDQPTTAGDQKPLVVEVPDKPKEALFLLNREVPPGAMQTLKWSPQNLFEGIPTPTPVLVANGAFEGPVVCLTGAIHGDEINGIETVRRIMYSLDPSKLSGAVVGIPIVNQMGFRRSSRYLPDRRDLNRYFPGTPTGSSASRIAYSLFEQIIRKCDALVDVHTGSFNRTNIPQLRADLSLESVKKLTRQFGDIVVLHSQGSVGTLRREAAQIGIPAVTLEAGEAMRIQAKVIELGVQHINTLLTNLKMVKRPFFWSNPQPVYMASRWLRAETGGIFISDRQPGDKIIEGDLLGHVTDPITNVIQPVNSTFNGKIIGMAMNQVVLPGYAIYHVGIDASAIHKQIEQIEATRERASIDTPVEEAGSIDDSNQPSGPDPELLQATSEPTE